jgi:predicted metal-dependent enzyme (double-stranded beta helix superfamily)
MSIAEHVNGLTGGEARPLERDELLALATRIGARADLWEPQLDTTADTRTYAALHRDASVDIWALFWLPEADTGWHDHDTSSGAVHVVEGELDEHALLVGRPERHVRHTTGGAFTFGPSHIHRLTCAVPRAISIHAYSPPLWRLGQYSVDADGALHRLSVSYADELRPLDAPELPSAV